MAFDLEFLAEKTINMLSVSKGQVIWIWASTYSLEFIEALAYRIRARGAFWTLRLTSESLLRRIGQDAPQESLSLIPDHEIRWMADISAIIEVRDHGGNLPDIPLSRRRAMGTEWIALIDAANKRNLRRIMVLNPTPALASAYGIPQERLSYIYTQALNIDDEELDTWQSSVSKVLTKTDTIQITSTLGTDLHLRIGERPTLQDKDSLPRGEVYVAPHENSANGTAVIDKLFIKGKLIEQLRLTFTDGKVTHVEAADPSGVEAFKELLSASSGDKDVIAEFAIGLNPGIIESIGNSLFDEKIGGSIHIAIGMNAYFGGNNTSNLHLDMVILHPTVKADERLILDNGLLQIGADRVQFS